VSEEKRLTATTTGTPYLKGVADVGGQVGQALGQEVEVLRRVLVGEGPAGDDLGPAAVHLQGPDGGHDDDAVRPQAARPALDVHELLHAALGPEARLGDDVAVRADKPEGDPVGDDRGVAVGDVGEGAGVDDGRGVLQGLHEVGHQGVLHQDGHGPGRAEVLGRHRLAGLVHADDDAAEPLAHVLEARRQGQDGHDLGGHRDVEARLALQAELLRAEADPDAAQEAVVDVDDPVPGDGLRVDIEAEDPSLVLEGQLLRVGLVDAELAEAPADGRGQAALAGLVGRAEPPEELVVLLVELVEDAGVDGRGQQVVGDRDGVDVAGQVEVEVLHGHDLGVAAAGGPALDAESRSHAGLADDGDDLFAEMSAEGLAEADGRRRLALAERGRGDGGDIDVAPQRGVREAVEDVEVDLGLEAAVELEVVLVEAERSGDLDDRPELGGLGDLDVCRDGLDDLDGHGGGLLRIGPL
jgi:hypothetical protein